MMLPNDRHSKVTNSSASLGLDDGTRPETELHHPGTTGSRRGRRSRPHYGAYGAGSAMIKVEKKGDSYAVSELFKNPDFGAHTQPPVLYENHFYAHYTINERSDGLVVMSMDGQVKCGRRISSQSVRLQAARERGDHRARRQLGTAGRHEAAGATRCKAPRQRWHWRQCRHFGICKFQI
jgi:hypothetical protein